MSDILNKGLDLMELGREYSEIQPSLLLSFAKRVLLGRKKPRAILKSTIFTVQANGSGTTVTLIRSVSQNDGHHLDFNYSPCIGMPEKQP
jgi:hypothetical protein